MSAASLPEVIDALVRDNTGFSSLDDMLNAAGHYRPSCDVSRANMRAIADAYDAAQAARGDERRAYRYNRGPRVGDRGEVWSNQANRACEVIATHAEDTSGALMLLVYTMPNGREYFLECPHVALRALADDNGYESVRYSCKPIAVKSAPIRWRAAIAAHLGGAK